MTDSERGTAGGSGPRGHGASAGDAHEAPGAEGAGAATEERTTGEERHGEGETAEERRQARRWGEAFSEVGDVVGDVVGEVLEGVRGVTSGRRFPRMDLVRVEGGYRVYVDVPGLSRDQVRVTTLGGQLTVAGERRRPELPEGAEVLRTERGFGTFERTMRMPPDVRERDVAASLEDGVLVIDLPVSDVSEAHDVEIG